MKSRKFNTKPVSKSQVKRFNAQQQSTNTRERTESDFEIPSTPSFTPSSTADFSGSGGGFDGGGASGDWD